MVFFRVSSMSPADTQVDCKHIESRGLTGIVRTDDEETWGDFCVVDSLMGPTLHCSWIRLDHNAQEVFLATNSQTSAKYPI